MSHDARRTTNGPEDTMLTCTRCLQEVAYSDIKQHLADCYDFHDVEVSPERSTKCFACRLGLPQPCRRIPRCE